MRSRKATTFEKSDGEGFLGSALLEYSNGVRKAAVGSRNRQEERAIHRTGAGSFEIPSRRCP